MEEGNITYLHSSFLDKCDLTMIMGRGTEVSERIFKDLPEWIPLRGIMRRLLATTVKRTQGKNSILFHCRVWTQTNDVQNLKEEQVTQVVRLWTWSKTTSKASSNTNPPGSLANCPYVSRLLFCGEGGLVR